MGTHGQWQVGRLTALGFGVALLVIAGLIPGGPKPAVAQEKPAFGPAAGPGGGPPAGIPPEVLQQMRERRGRRGGDGPPPGMAQPPGGMPQPSPNPQPPNGGEKKPEGEAKPDEKKPETPSVPTVSRPGNPPKPGNPEELKLRPDADGKFQLNFTNQKWQDVLEWLADSSKMSLDWQEMPADYLNLVTTERYTIDEARDLINQRLLARGFTLLRHGEVLSVVKLDSKLNPALVPWVRPEQLDERDTHEFVRVTFSLDWLLADPTAKELEPMRSPYGKISPLTSTNRIEVMDVVINLREIQRILAEEQSKTGEDRLTKTFPLKYTRASEVRELLLPLLGIEEKKKGPQPDQQQQQPQPQPQPRPGQQPGQPEKKEVEVHIVADERLNTVVVSAPPDKMAVVAQAIASIDQPTAGGEGSGKERPKTYRLESVDPEAAVKTLKELHGLSVTARFEVDKSSKSVIAYAAPADQLLIASAIDKLDGGRRRFQVVPMPSELRVDSVARIIESMMGGGSDEGEKIAATPAPETPSFNPFMGGMGGTPPDRSSSRRRGGGSADRRDDRFRVDADVRGNRLLLWCNEYERAKVDELLENLRTTPLRTNPSERSVQVHRLVTLDPEPVIKMLRESELLSVGTSVEPDPTTRALIANATEADHQKIKEFIKRLDGSSRNLEVLPLRRLQADSVAGSVAFMMTGKEEEKNTRSNPWDWGWGGRSRETTKKKEDEFRVDADVEYNRLLLWCNAVELEAVKKLLVKLGEIPAEASNPSSIRFLDLPPGPERERLLEQLRRLWPSTANPLEIPPPTPAKPEESPPPKAKPREAVPRTGATTQTLPSGVRFRLAQLEQTPVSETPATEAAPREESPAATAQAPAQTPAAATAQKPAPIRMTEGPDGQLILSSEDTQALDRLEDLIAQLSPQPRSYEIIHLQYADAYGLALTLKDFFDEKEKKDDSRRSWGWGWGMDDSSSSNDSRRLSRRRTMKFLSDDATNSILIQGGTPEQLRTAKELIAIYNRPTPTDSESSRRTQPFKIRFAKASTVAEAIKEVYRDLLSENDKALSNNRRSDQRSATSYTYNFGGNDKGVEKRPKFKGYLSMGIDDESNTLIVSAPEFLFRDIAQLIDDLDHAAQPNVEQMYVLRLQSGINGAKLQERLKSLLEANATSVRPGQNQPEDQGGPRENRGRRGGRRGGGGDSND